MIILGVLGWVGWRGGVEVLERFIGRGRGVWMEIERVSLAGLALEMRLCLMIISPIYRGLLGRWEWEEMGSLESDIDAF